MGISFILTHGAKGKRLSIVVFMLRALPKEVKIVTSQLDITNLTKIK